LADTRSSAEFTSVSPLRTVAGMTAAVAASAGIVAVALLSGPGREAAAGPSASASHAHYVWGDTPRDWVSWADRIAVVEVLGEEQVPSEPGELEGDSGWVARRIHAGIAQTIWARRGTASPPRSVKLRTTDGWWYNDGALTPMTDLGAYRGEVGDRLLVAMIHSDDWGWTLMSGGVRVGATGRLLAGHDQSDIGAQLHGTTLPQVTRTFRSAKPFADVIRFRHLDLEERMIAVDRYRNRARAG
jgi:hypothetical protein